MKQVTSTLTYARTMERRDGKDMEEVHVRINLMRKRELWAKQWCDCLEVNLKLTDGGEEDSTQLDAEEVVRQLEELRDIWRQLEDGLGV